MPEIPKIPKLPEIPKIRKLPKILKKIPKISKIPWRIDTPLKKPENPYFTTTDPKIPPPHIIEDIGEPEPVFINTT